MKIQAVPESEKLEAIRLLVDEAHKNFDRWKYRKGKDELNIHVSKIIAIIAMIRTPENLAKANEIVWNHSRLYEAVLKRLDVFIAGL